MAQKYSKKRPGLRSRYPRGRAVRRRRSGLAGKLLLGLLALLLAAWLQWPAGRPDQGPAEPPKGEPPLELITADSFIGRVARVGDGDTLDVAFGEAGTLVRVRLYGLDAPELNQPHGREARDFLSKLVLNREVRVEKQDLDQYGRVVGQVFDSGLSVNLTLVASGQAWVYERYCQAPICRQMKAEEARARQKKLGLWAQADPQPPWQWRKSQGGRSR